MGILRLTIFSFYDEDGVVYPYISYLLKELKLISTRLIIVVNGILSDEGKNIFESFTSEILLRQNKGFDCGAYKYVLCRYLPYETLQNFNELILCNDTFFGPFYSMTDIFEKISKCDFWGLNYVKGYPFTCLQSYFYVFGEKIIKDGELLRFFENYIDENEEDIKEIYGTFEDGISCYLNSKGYEWNSFVYGGNWDIYRSGDIAIEKCGVPILKKKFFKRCKNPANLYHALDIIRKMGYYPVELIINTIRQKYDVEIFNDVNGQPDEFKFPISDIENTMDDFLNKHDSIYIYGTGIFAREIFHDFLKNNSKLKGFIISEKSDEEILYGLPIMRFNEYYSDKAVIVGMNVENTRDVVLRFGKRSNWLYLWDDEIIGRGY